jgi:hypothetical protein
VLSHERLDPIDIGCPEPIIVRDADGRQPELGRLAITTDIYRQGSLSKAVCDIAWKAQLRLTFPLSEAARAGKRNPKSRPPSRASSPASSGRSRGRCRRHPHNAHGDQVRQVGGIADRWRTLEDVMDISTTDTSAPRARQLRDEPQSGRYPPRGYQQRQPSLERGVVDQTDLKNEEHGKSVLIGELTTTLRRDGLLG